MEQPHSAPQLHAPPLHAKGTRDDDLEEIDFPNPLSMLNVTHLLSAYNWDAQSFSGHNTGGRW